MYKVGIEEEVKIHVITDPEEVEYYSDVLTRKHYLGSSLVNIRTLVQVARRGRTDLAILTWEPNVRRWFYLRDDVIGWNEDQKRTRSKYCFENRRFLMLSDQKNLASKILKRGEENLGREAEKLYGHGCMLVETFVDPSRGLEGTCYKAAGWKEVGLTKGGKGREASRKPKLYFIKELKKDAIGKLKSPKLSPTDTKNPRQKILSLDTFDIKGLRQRLNAIPDTRQRKGWYPPSALLALIMMAVLSGESTISDIHRWISSLSVELLRTIGCRKCPSYGVLRSTLIKTDHVLLSKILCQWLIEQEGKIHIDKRVKILSLDGKRMRAASSAGDTEIHLLELVDAVTQVVHAQLKVSTNKENEIPVAQEMLRNESIDAETIITADAMHTQRKTADIIVKKTPITYSLSKTTRRTSKKLSSKTPQRKIGRYKSILRSLDMEG